MNKIILILLVVTFFSCDKTPESAKPEPSLSPPQWFIGTWNHSDSTGVIESLIVSEKDVVVERFTSSGKLTTSYVDSCKTNSIELKDFVKYNAYYNLEFTDENENVYLMYFAKIAYDEVRFLNHIRPTPKTYTRVSD